MTCVIGKTGETRLRTATVTLHRAATTVVVKGVPAEVGDTCGEYYLDAAVAHELYAHAVVALHRRAEVEILHYAA